MPIQVLVIHSDHVTLKAVDAALHSRGFAVTCTRSAREGLSLLQSLTPKLLIVGPQLNDMSGADVVREGLRRCSVAKGLVIRRLGYELGDEWTLPGDVTVADEPSTPERLAALVADCLRADLAQPTVSYSLCRWATLVGRALDSDRDLKTLDEWGRAIGVSRGNIRNWCRTAGLSARASLQFTRVLRALIRHQTSRFLPEDVLDIVDRRTLAKLFKRSGGSPSKLPANLDEFLSRQQFIQDARAVETIRTVILEGRIQSKPDFSSNRNAGSSDKARSEVRFGSV